MAFGTRTSIASQCAMTQSAYPASSQGNTRLRIAFALGTLAIAGVLVWLWSATPLREVATVEALSEWAQQLEDMRTAPLIVLAVYVVGGLILLPVSLTIAVTGLVFGAWPGLLYALVGTAASAMATYGVGAAIGGERLARLGGKRVEALSHKVARKGLRSVITIRIVPVAPFAVINAILGASHVSWRDYLLGTLIGMSPGILIKVLFADQLAEAATTSDENSLWLLAGAAVVLVALGILVRRHMRNKAPQDKE